jgi:hypothetical protein
VRPASWSRLRAGTLLATVSGPHGTRRIALRGSSPRVRLVRGFRVSVKRVAGRRAVVDAAVALNAGADGGRLAVIIHSGRRLLATLSARGGTLAATGGNVHWLTPKLPRGRLSVDAVVAATGPPAGAASVPAVQVLRRTLTLRA